MSSLVENTIVNNYLDRVRDAINTADERNTPAESVAPEHYPDVISLLKVDGVYTIGTDDIPEGDRLRYNVVFQKEDDTTERNECYFVTDASNNMMKCFINDELINEIDEVKSNLENVRGQLIWQEN